MRNSTRLLVFALAVSSAPVPAALGQSAFSGEPTHIARVSGPIVIDGDLSDEGWRDSSTRRSTSAIRICARFAAR
jgi:hypothetical protein